MTGKDNIKMIINIGGERLKLDVPFDSQNEVRDAESKAAALFNELRKIFPSRSDTNIMAMVAYYMAEESLQLKKAEENALEAAMRCNNILTQAIDS